VCLKPQSACFASTILEFKLQSQPKKKKKEKLIPARLGDPLSAPWRQRWNDCEFKASQGYISKLRPVWTIYEDTVLKK
jgi:hypothetical protein